MTYPARLFLQIVYPNNEVVRFDAGGHPPRVGTLEADLIDLCTEAILAKGVGLFPFRTRARTRQLIHDGLTDALQTFKDRTVTG